MSFALLILLSGMNFTISIHTCGMKVEAVKWSFTGKKASCGMESDKESCPAQKGFSENCCKDKTTIYTVDNNYKPSDYQNNKVSIKYIQIFSIPLSTLFNSYNTFFSNNSNVIPPNIALTSSVYLPEICVFRI